MATWFSDQKLSWLEWLTVRVLTTGNIPHHMAVIMDGNRRFARKHQMVVVEGHTSGFDKLVQMLKWCKEFGIFELTVYAFSLENFKRNENEVKELLNLARTKFEILWESREKAKTEGVRVRVFGDVKRLPLDIQKSIAKVVLFTQDHNKFNLNICVAYTGREDIFQAVKWTATGVQLGLIQPEDITEAVLQSCLYTGNSVEPDLLIRTSGETRLSDFLLWQSSYSVLAFVDVLWPEFTFWNLAGAIFYYQRNVEHSKKYKELKNRQRKEEDNPDRNKRVEKFVEFVSEKRIQMFKDVLHS
ncbi:hypothetical protein CHUAL_013930 [Chamberlinius hualienensis]